MSLHITLMDSVSSAPATLEMMRGLLRASLGPFFAISGYHKLFNSTRRASLASTFQADGLKSPAFMYAIPLGELFGGLGVAVGALTSVACLGLIALCLGATVFDGRKRVASEAPLDLADRADDYLYLPEVLYVVMLALLALLGGGQYSLDALL